jgi:hypothetical protein
LVIGLLVGIIFEFCYKIISFLSGFGLEPYNITASIVIFGDHKQLGAVLESEYAEKMGLGKTEHS